MKKSMRISITLTMLLVSACAGITQPGSQPQPGQPVGPPTAIRVTAFPFPTSRPATIPPQGKGSGAPPPSQPVLPPTPDPPGQGDASGGAQGGQPGQNPPSVAVVTGPTLAPYTLDTSALPIGDSRLSTGPQQGYLWQCASPGNGGGAMLTGDWFNLAAGTWNMNTKPIVDGAVTWPHELSITVQGDKRIITGNGLPSHPTGVYPVAANDDAAIYDRNPNSIKANPISWSLPANPTANAEPQCVHAGLAGILLTGAIFFNGTDALNRDAVAHEIQDACDGHPQNSGVYHYHNVSPCADPGTGPSGVVGFAADGFPITGFRDANGRNYTDADLDECHGLTSLIELDGKLVMMYHYVATYEFPYSVGCYRGTPAVSDQPGQGGQQGGQQGGNQSGPPGGGPGGQGGQGGQGGGPPPPPPNQP